MVPVKKNEIEVGDRVKVVVKGYRCSFWGKVTRVGTDHIAIKKDGMPFPISDDVDIQHIVALKKGGAN